MLHIKSRLPMLVGGIIIGTLLCGMLACGSPKAAAADAWQDCVRLANQRITECGGELLSHGPGGFTLGGSPAEVRYQHDGAYRGWQQQARKTG